MCDCDNYVYKHGDFADVIADASYNTNIVGKSLCEIHNNGNGFHITFFSHHCARQDKIMSLDYDEAALLIKALSAFKKELGYSEN